MQCPSCHCCTGLRRQQPTPPQRCSTHPRPTSRSVSALPNRAVVFFPPLHRVSAPRNYLPSPFEGQVSQAGVAVFGCHYLPPPFQARFSQTQPGCVCEGWDGGQDYGTGAFGLSTGGQFKRWLWLTRMLGSWEGSGQQVRGLILFLSWVFFFPLTLRLL